MAPIQILSEQLVNQIAAGEVIERPASAVKELFENAIDAQAGRIDLELEEAGKKLIRVSDDGLGIPAAEVPLALSSHATSKIASSDDLEGITTLGFRGEALASIASVADVRLVSRTAEALEAMEITVSGGKAAPPRPTSGPVGTTVEVRNLFRYVPARRKFLKTDATEMGHITEQVTRVALAYPAVHLSVRHNGRNVYDLPPTESLRERIGVFFGPEVAQSLLEVGSEEPAGKLWGLIGPPHLARATTATQYLFLNGRYVRDRGLFHALREAYRGMLEGGQQSVAFLFLTVPPDRVDVNVHPTKIEVRLRDGHLLYGQVLAAVRQRLLGPGSAPSFVMPQDAEPASTRESAEPPQGDDERRARVRQAVADFLRSPAAAPQARLPLQGRAPVDESRSASPPHPALSLREREKGSPLSPQEREKSSPLSPGERVARPGEGASAPPAAGEPAAASRAVQLHNTYLVAETEDGILIVDQHALHERVLFEEIMQRLEAGPLEGQRLLVPMTLDLTDREMAAVEAHREALGQLGIEAEAMGPRSVGIHAFPAILERADPAATLRDFLGWVLALDEAPTARQVLERLAHVAACRAAVKAGDPLKPEEIEALLSRREAADMAPTCPHGRPAALVLRKSDLEKQFGRDYAAPGRATENERLPF